MLLIAVLCLAGNACQAPPPALHQAVQDQDADRVELLLQQGADADRRWRYTQSGHSGATFELSPLELAVVRDNQAIIRALACHADIYAQNANDMTPFEWAIRFGHPEHARLLWELSDRSTYRAHAANALRLAREDPETFQWLLEEVATDESVGELFAFWAGWGARGRDDGMRYIRELLDLGLEPDHQALRAAVRNRNPQITDLLLDLGLNVDGEAGELPPLHIALFTSWDLTVAELLLKRGADPNALDPWGRTPAMTVVRVRSFHPNRSAEELRAAFHRQAMVPLTLLRDHGADLAITDPQGRTLADYVDTAKDPDHAYSRGQLQALMAPDTANTRSVSPDV